MQIVHKPLSTKGAKTITLSMVKKALQKTLKKHGADTIYKRKVQEVLGYQPTSCQYTLETPNGPVPGCLVGTLFVEEFDTDIQEFLKSRTQDGLNFGILNNARVLTLLNESEFRANGYSAITREAATFLSYVQSFQDQGNSWGYAVKAAENDMQR